MTNELLKNKYREILNRIDPRYLGMAPNRPGGPMGLSGLFLPSVSENFSQAKNKVMIVGLETRYWEVLKKGGEFESVSAYVDEATAKHQSFFAKALQNSNGRGNGFHNYTRQISKAKGIDKDGLIYANLFCFSWKKGSPTKWKEEAHFNLIKQWSGEILNAQIEVLQPNYIVFAGFSGGPYRREFLTAEKCTSSKNHPPIPERFLLEFLLDKKIRCFRVDHPSAVYKKRDKAKEAKKGRDHVIQLLEKAVAEAVAVE